MSWDKDTIAQISLPDSADDDPHPSLLLRGLPIHAGDCFVALMPDGWHRISIEMNWDPQGPACWYIATPGYTDISPLGLFVRRA